MFQYIKGSYMNFQYICHVSKTLQVVLISESY